MHGRLRRNPQICVSARILPSPAVALRGYFPDPVVSCSMTWAPSSAGCDGGIMTPMRKSTAASGTGSMARQGHFGARAAFSGALGTFPQYPNWLLNSSANRPPRRAPPSRAEGGGFGQATPYHSLRSSPLSMSKLHTRRFLPVTQNQHLMSDGSAIARGSDKASEELQAALKVTALSPIQYSRAVWEVRHGR
jgi:hypothetical protein